MSVLLLSFLLATEDLFTSGDRQKMISTPDKPTKVYIGENVSLVWQYYQPAHVTLFEVVFGYWKNPGYLHPKLIAVDLNGVPRVRAGYELAVAWAGNLTSSLAVFVLYNVQPADGNVDFGIQVEFGLAHNPLTDIVRLQVEAKPIPDLPRITHITTPPLLRKGQNVSLSCTASGLSLINVTWYKGQKVASNHGNGTSKAVFRLHNITCEDSGEYVCVAKNLAGEHRKTVYLRILPASPKILNTNMIARNASWILRWSAIYSERHLVKLYTVWHRILRVAEDNKRRKELWSRENVTGFMFRKELAADTRYMFAVTAWNKWGESAIESDKILIVSTNFTDGVKTTILLQTISTEPGTLISPTSKSNKKDEKSINAIIMAMSIVAIASFSLLVAGLCCLRKNCACVKDRNKGQQEIRAMTRLSFTSQVNLTSESAQEPAEERRSVILSGSPVGIPDSFMVSEQSPTSVTNNQENYNQPSTGKCFLLTSFRPALNDIPPAFTTHEQPTPLRTFFPDRGSEGTSYNQDDMSVINSSTPESENQVAMETNSPAAVNNVSNNVGIQTTRTVMEADALTQNQVANGTFQPIKHFEDYLQPVDSENLQVRIKHRACLGDRKVQTLRPRPQPKPRWKNMGKRETEKHQCKSSTFSGPPSSLQFTDLRTRNPPNEKENDNHCACTKATDQTNLINQKRFHGAHGYQNERFAVASYQNTAVQSSSVKPIGNGDSPYTRVNCNTNWEIPRDNLSLFERIGGGSFGQVWKGAGRDVNGAKGWSIVAVKMLKENSSKLDLKDLLSELDLLKKLKPHPNVIRLLGCVTKDVVRCQGKREFRPPLVILEFVPHGDLLGYLKKSKREIDDYYDLRSKEVSQKITEQQLYQFAADIARGMEFIAAHQLIHRDLAARNVLVGEGLRCKITDFGMARDLGRAEIYVRRSNGLVPMKWMAVESLIHHVYTTESDVWSYGIVLYEIFTLGRNPYDGMAGEDVFHFVASGHRMRRTSSISPELYNLMLQCWEKDPSKRPTFSAIAFWMESRAF